MDQKNFQTLDGLSNFVFNFSQSTNDKQSNLVPLTKPPPAYLSVFQIHAIVLSGN